MVGDLTWRGGGMLPGGEGEGYNLVGNPTWRGGHMGGESNISLSDYVKPMS
jgi:hypothetical protein